VTSCDSVSITFCLLVKSDDLYRHDLMLGKIRFSPVRLFFGLSAEPGLSTLEVLYGCRYLNAQPSVVQLLHSEQAALGGGRGRALESRRFCSSRTGRRISGEVLASSP